MSYNRRLIIFLFTVSLLASCNCFALTDPTMPSDEQSQVTSNIMQLNAILIGKDRRFAVINGVIVHEGQSVNNMKVLRIDANSVELDGADGRFVLQLLTSPLKQVK